MAPFLLLLISVFCVICVEGVCELLLFLMTLLWYARSGSQYRHNSPLQ